MTTAYSMVREEGVSVRYAAKCHGVPPSTLRDRIDSRISIDVVKSGPSPLLDLEQEARLAAHIKELAEVGYGYTRSEVVTLASDYAVSLGKRAQNQPLTLKWFYNFLGRWPELKVVKPSSLSEQRAKCANHESVSRYFLELNRIINKYNLKDRPDLIYNIDEKGINTEYKPPNVVAGRECKPQSVMAERSKTITVIGAGNALGHQIPPFFVFPGERMAEKLLEGKSTGADGVVTPSGWSNAEVFRRYLKTHFMQYCQGGRNTEDPLLILYDGHKSHISIDLVDWAKENNIILFVLPPHTSHILQPMDVGCFGPFQLKYNQECTTFSRANHRVVTKYDVCSLACKAYGSALTPCNIQSSFRRTGIFPLQTPETMTESLHMKLMPSTLYGVQDVSEIQQVTENTGEKEPMEIVQLEDAECVQRSETPDPDIFFQSRKGKVVERVVKKRKNISKVIGGRALEGETLEKMKEYLNDATRKCNSKGKNALEIVPPKKSKSSPMTIKKKKPASSKNDKENIQNKASPKPGPSGMMSKFLIDDSESDSIKETESEIDESEKCCHCKHFYVQNHDHNLFIVNWVQCDSCLHWVHLKFCTDIRVARKNTSFVCNCCK